MYRGVDSNGNKRRNFSHDKSTLSSSVKHKYIVRSRHTALCGDKFVPVNKSQAKAEVKIGTIHDDGQPMIDETF